MYAIIATGGKQYKVAEGDVIRVEKLGVEAGETVTFDQVLAVSNDGLKVGEDVKNASVTASVVGNGKGKKVIVYKYKRKTGYHKKNGHRQQYTEVKIEKLNAEADSTVEFDRVIAAGNDGDLKFGTPTVEGAKVTAKVIKNGKSKKITVFTYRAKKDSKRKMGHRQPYSKIKIEAINA